VPPPERIFSHVYSEPNHQIEQQQAEFLGYLAGFEDEVSV
jgi:2-oxoisovalerate dehydrogenase E1 component alpha subunit